MPTRPISPLAPAEFAQTIAAQLQAAGPMLEALQDWLEEQAGASLKQAMQIGLMVDELVTNTITHGYPAGQGVGCIEVKAWLQHPCVVVSLTDDALAFDPLGLPQPDLTLDIEQRQIGGLGVYFVRQLADEIRYSRRAPEAAQGNTLCFSKRLEPQPGLDNP